DGFGQQGFSAAIPVTTTNVGGNLRIPAQACRTIDAEAGLVYDRSPGPHNGRVYLVYTDKHDGDDTDGFLRFSDNNGMIWSDPPVRVNDDPTINSQFLPRIALDQSNGCVGVTWYDARDDLGLGGKGDHDGLPNDEARFFGAISTDGGASFLPNFQIAEGASSAPASPDSDDYGDYTGLTFFTGNLYPLRADNSVKLGANP